MTARAAGRAGVLPLGRAGALLAAGAGALAALGQAPWGLWPLAILGAAAAMALAARAGPGRAAWTGWAFGAGHFAVALHWIVEPFLIDVARHGWMAPFALVLLAGGLALFPAAAFWIAARLAPGRVLLALPAAWTLAEALRMRVFTGFPWAAPGQALIDTPLDRRRGARGAAPFGSRVCSGRPPRSPARACAPTRAARRSRRPPAERWAAGGPGAPGAPFPPRGRTRP